MSTDIARERRVLLVSKYVKSWDGSDEKPVLCKLVSLVDALTNKYVGDKYILPYECKGEEKMPRLSVPALARFALDSVAKDEDNAVDFAETELSCALIDVDAPGHKESTNEWVAGVVEKIPAWMNAGWYKTRNGMRIVLLPRERVPILYADSYLDWVCGHLRNAGIQLDETTSQCLRMQRAPRALNMDLPLDYSGLGVMERHPGGGDLELRDAHAFGEVVRYGSEITADVSKKFTKTEFAPIKKILGLAASEKIREGRLRIPRGKRHGQLVQLAVSIAEALETDDPADVFNVLYRTAELNFAGEPGRNWVQELTGIVKWATAWVVGRKEHVADQKEQAVRDLTEASGIQERDVKQHLIVSHGKTCHFLCERTGRYDLSVSNKDEMLVGLVQASPRLGWSIAIENPSKAELLRDYGVIAERVLYSYTPRTPQFDPKERILYVDGARLCDDMYPEYNADIAKWLMCLAGNDDKKFGYLNSWLAAFPRLDRALCALYIHAPRGMGKQMLALGLARAYSRSKEYVSYEDVVGDFQEKLLRSPLIWGDEKAAGTKGKTDSHAFRVIVGNDGQQVNEKHKSRVQIDGYPRLLVTANNDDAFKIREELDKEDIDAIEQRVGYIRVEADVAAFLTAMAEEKGFESAREMTEAWVNGGGIARHMLWLAENYKFQMGKRFLVDGWESEWTQNLALRVGMSASVGTTVARAMLSRAQTDAVRAFEGKVFVNTALLLEEWEQHAIPNSKTPSSQHALNKSLRMLSSTETQKLDSIKGRAHGQRRYYVIPAASIGRIAEQYQVAEEDEIRAIANRPRSEETEIPAPFSSKSGRDVMTMEEVRAGLGAENE